MVNDKKSISANEINKYTYCPYQWYYERYYGTKHLREKYRERNELYATSKSIDSNFNKGLKFHKNYLLIQRLKLYFKIIILIMVVAIVVYLFNRIKGF